MYYVPGCYDKAFNFLYINDDGNPIGVSSLISKHPIPVTSTKLLDALPSSMQKDILEYKKTKLTKEYNWNTYQDCPFVSKKMINDYSMIANTDGTGRYAMIYKILVSIAGKALKRGYNISVDELVELVKEIDRDTSNKYQKRNLKVEAERALIYAYKNL
jgi:hypothetical protein